MSALTGLADSIPLAAGMSAPVAFWRDVVTGGQRGQLCRRRAIRHELLVDVMTLGDRASAHIWFPFSLFIGLIVRQNLLAPWRLGGWLGCRDRSRGLCGHAGGPAQTPDGSRHALFFQHLAGALANRISSRGRQRVRFTVDWRGISFGRAWIFSMPRAVSGEHRHVGAH